jgi:hypothetical protein
MLILYERDKITLKSLKTLPCTKLILPTLSFSPLLKWRQIVGITFIRKYLKCEVYIIKFDSGA